MLQLIQVGNAMPVSFPVDPSAEFQSGQIAQLKLVNQDIVCGVSDGRAPFGVLDDVRSRAFTQTVVDEVVLIQVIRPNISIMPISWAPAFLLIMIVWS